MRISQDNNQERETKSKSNGMIDNRLSLIGRFFIQRFATNNSWQTHQLYTIIPARCSLWGRCANLFIFTRNSFFFSFFAEKFSTFFFPHDQTGICFADKTSKMGDSIAEIGVYAALKGGNFT
jgi:hypothetical protein